MDSAFCDKRFAFKDLAVLLWYSFGTTCLLLQEVLAVYPAISAATLSSSASNRACNALALLQTIASHQGTPFECLRHTSLGVLGALVQDDDEEVINFLLQSEAIPWFLQLMEMGSETSKMVATYIMQKILLNDSGLKYICATADRFFNVASVLATMVNALVEQPSTKVLKQAIRCYLRLTYHPRALVALRISFPEALKDGTFDNCLRDDPVGIQCLQQLLDRLKNGGEGGASLAVPDPVASGSTWEGAPPLGSGAIAGGSMRGAFPLDRNSIWAWKDGQI